MSFRFFNTKSPIVTPTFISSFPLFYKTHCQIRKSQTQNNFSTAYYTINYFCLSVFLFCLADCVHYLKIRMGLNECSVSGWEISKEHKKMCNKKCRIHEHMWMDINWKALVFFLCPFSSLVLIVIKTHFQVSPFDHSLLSLFSPLYAGSQSTFFWGTFYILMAVVFIHSLIQSFPTFLLLFAFASFSCSLFVMLFICFETVGILDWVHLRIFFKEEEIEIKMSSSSELRSFIFYTVNGTEIDQLKSWNFISEFIPFIIFQR